jgi:hypothetical protein
MPKSNVSLLEVAMHDQAAMCVRHNVADLHEQRQTRREIELLLLAVLGERPPLDILHDHVRAAILIHPAVQQPSNARMFEARENLALALKSR